jgi:predicted NUDIX family NTP pyrophosphohydrolase
MMEFPEIDRARWMEYGEAITLINPAQIPFLDRAKHTMKDLHSV